MGAWLVVFAYLSLGAGPEFEVAPPAHLEPLMRASEAERLHHIRLAKDRIRNVLDRSRASLSQVAGVLAASDGSGSVVAAVAAAGLKLDVRGLGTLREAEQTLARFRDQVFVRPVLRNFTPNNIGMIHGATVLRIYDDVWPQSCSHPEWPEEIAHSEWKPRPSWRRLLVEMPNKTRIMIKSFPGELVAEGKPLANPGTIYRTTGYTEYEDDVKERTALVAEILFIPGFDAYLEELKQVHQALKDPAVRRWKGQDGTELLIGKFVGFRRGKVNIHKPDGTTEAVPMTQLAAEDQRYVRNALKKQSKAEEAKR